MDSTGATVLLVYSTGTVATVPKVFFFPPIIGLCFFFSFKYLYKLAYILLYWHNKFHNIFTIIEVSISYKSKLKKIYIWDCDQPQLKINVLRKCYNIYYYHNIFTIVEISISYISNKKNAKSITF